MPTVAIPLLIVGTAQWFAVAWWYFVDGLAIRISFGIICLELFGIVPRVSWDPAEVVLMRILDASPGTVFIVIGLYLLLRERVRQITASMIRVRQLSRHRQAIR